MEIIRVFFEMIGLSFLIIFLLKEKNLVLLINVLIDSIEEYTCTEKSYLIKKQISKNAKTQGIHKILDYLLKSKGYKKPDE